MRGSIHSDDRCPVCGSHYRLGPKGLACPNHPKERPHHYVVRYGKITKRFGDYDSALNFLSGLRFEDSQGKFDPRDYQVKEKPLSFLTLSDEWLRIKRMEVRPGSMPPLVSAIKRGYAVWGDTNIKNIQYPQLEDLITSLRGKLAIKTIKNTQDALKQFWAWLNDRYEIEPIKKWPKLGRIEMAFRKTVSIHDQEVILDEVHKIATAAHRYRSWLGIKWLCTYICIRPGEMRKLTEGDIDRRRGLIIVPSQDAKERKTKIVPLLPEDVELLRALPEAAPNTPFFRHDPDADPHTRCAGKMFGICLFRRDWETACKRLGFEGVDLYGGTKHSTAMGLRVNSTFEEVRKATGHATNKAFERYFKLEGEDIRNIFARRNQVVRATDNGDNADNRLITDPEGVESN